jgi:FlaA1/EpsC-like NDP-sugar epimerase
MTQNSSELVTYENVLGRNPRSFQFEDVELNFLASKRFLVTGAGGSIGSRITFLLAKIPNLRFLATDRDESALHSLSLEISKTALFDDGNFALLDIKDKSGVSRIITDFKPDVIIHAAALKHLSMLEKQSEEAIQNNVFGTANLIEIAYKHRIPFFMNISTDKAADPASILGKTKKATELYLSHFRNENLLWTSCRFGNVFNSRGSVIETFLSQIKSGSPITLTDESVSRYFMHTDEAAFLSVKSLILNMGEVHVFNMGQTVLLIDVINRLQDIFQSFWK